MICSSLIRFWPISDAAQFSWLGPLNTFLICRSKFYWSSICRYSFELQIKYCFDLQNKFWPAGTSSICKSKIFCLIKIGYVRIRLKTDLFNILEKLHFFTTEVKVKDGPSTFRVLYNSEQKWATEKKYSMTHLFIKLPRVFMKELKKKLKLKCISICTRAIKSYLVWVEPKLSQFWLYKISVKINLYSKLFSKSYFEYFSRHTHLLKNQKVIISCNKDFCNFKIKVSANWNWKANHWSNINKWKGLVC